MPRSSNNKSALHDFTRKGKLRANAKKFDVRSIDGTQDTFGCQQMIHIHC